MKRWTPMVFFIFMSVLALLAIVLLILNVFTGFKVPALVAVGFIVWITHITLMILQHVLPNKFIDKFFK